MGTFMSYSYEYKLNLNFGTRKLKQYICLSYHCLLGIR